MAVFPKKWQLDLSFYKFVTQNLSSFNRLVTLENDVFSEVFWYASNSYTQMHSKTSEAGGGGIKSTPYCTHTWPQTKTSVAPGQPSVLCLHFCFVLFRPWFPIFNPCYVINFKLEFLRPDRTKCLETWYHYCILPNLKNSLLQFLEKMSLLEDACLGLDFPFLALAMI